MSLLSLVRHAQASFFAENYDQLSPLGEQQARLLGEHWLRRGVRIDEVFTGPRARQIETAALAGEAFARSGLSWPEPKIVGELDEHQVDRLIKLAIREVIGEHPHVEPLHAAYAAAEAPRDRHRTFQLMFEQVVMLWVEGKAAADGVESWADFRARVAAGMERVTAAEGRGRNVAAFTSVGAITVALQLGTGCSDRAAFDMGWRVRNCSITDFVFTRNRLTLDGFNAYPHLEDPAMWTYR
jgi:broad specificity phosphatase PhoE